jgi:hypothetical protein
MVKEIFNKLIPHLIAVAVFLVVAMVYCKPSLEGKVVQQSDITHWKGSMKQSDDFYEQNGYYPLWSNSVFSGMPAFQIGGNADNYIAHYFQKIVKLGMPDTIQFFFMASIFFYLLCVVLGVNPYLGILGSLAFAYSTYNPIIISVGHNSKMMAIAYMPAVLAGVILIFDKKYWLGFMLTALFTSLQIAMNHFQISYYIYISIGILSLFFAIRWIREKEFKHIFLSAFLLIASISTGVLTNGTILFGTYEYQKETIRGGSSNLDENMDSGKSSGLSKEYSFDYSMGIAEPFVMLVPRMFGGSSGGEEIKQEDSKAIEVLRRLPQDLQQQLPMTYYWGGIERGTSGPPYMGAIICFLAIMGMFVLDNKYKWWVITTVGITIMMSWGSYFESFNGFLFDHLPFYNKFRAPSMIMVVSQLLLPFMAVLTVSKILNEENKTVLFESFKKGIIATAAVFAVLLGLYMSMDFLNSTDKNILAQIRDINNPQLTEAVRSFIDALKEDRKSMMLNDTFRSLGFIAVAALLLYLSIKNKLKAVPVMLGLIAFTFIDLISVDTKYLNSDNYMESFENDAVFQKTKADEEILKDKTTYRVFNIAGDRFNENITSYHYNSVGGYHAAKLRIYQDLIEKQLSKPEMNIPVLNMLNAKYVIQKDQKGMTQAYQEVPGALGPCWLVKGIQYVKDAQEEMSAIDSFNPRDTAIIQESFKASIPFNPEPDSSASINLIKNDNDAITYTFESSKNQFAVFSEIYYDAGWKAFVNDKQIPIVKVNYVLRGLALEAGKYNIEFKFEPELYMKGKMLAKFSTYFILLVFALGLFVMIRNRTKA